MKSTKLFSLMIIIFIITTNELVAQPYWNMVGGDLITSTAYLGDNGFSSYPLRLKTLTNYNIEFYTNTNQAMTILGSNQYVGIGIINPLYNLSVRQHISIDTPVYPYAGNGYIGSYMIGDTTVLHNVGTGNIFCGNLAGVSQYLQTGYSNAFFGNSAGMNNTIGYQNTFIGNSAGYTNDTGYNNCFTGIQAGYHNTKGSDNTFNGGAAGYYSTTGGDNCFYGFYAGLRNTTGFQNVIVGSLAGSLNTMTSHSNTILGHEAGYSNTTGNWNTMTGVEAGFATTIGFSNSFYGKKAGHDNVDGIENCFFGAHSGFLSRHTNFNCFYGQLSGWIMQGDSNAFYGSNTGQYFHCGYWNTFIGHNAQNTWTTSADTSAYWNCLNNSAAIGANTLVTADNKMILANDSSFVGIGLSHDFTSYHGPRNRLEINVGKWVGSSGYHFDEPTHGVVGFSGLQFRDLTAYCMPIDNPSCIDTIGPSGCSVLSVDEHGNVILVKEHGKGFGFEACGSIGNVLPNINPTGYGIELNNNNVYFSDGATLETTPTKNSFGIGWSCGHILNAKVDILRGNTALSPSGAQSYPIGLLVQNNEDASGGGASTSIGIQSGVTGANTYNYAGWFIATGALGTGINTGVQGVATSVAGTPALFNEGGFFNAQDGTHNFGINGTANSTLLGYVPTGYNIGGNFLAKDGPINYGIYSLGGSGTTNPELTNYGVYATAQNGQTKNTGVYGEAFGGNAPINYGGHFYASNGTADIVGVKGEADGLGNPQAHGVVGVAFNSPAWNNGVFGAAIPVAGATNIGVVGYVNNCLVPPFGTWNIGVYGDLGMGCVIPYLPCYPPGCPWLPMVTGPNYAGYFNGDLVTTTTWYSVSDSTLKQNIENLTNPLEIIAQLRPKKYVYNFQGNQSMQLPTGTHAGLLSQDVEQVLPNLVKNSVHPARYDSTGNEIAAAIPYKALNYTELIPYLIGSVQQLDSANHALQYQINNLTTIINSCCENQQPNAPRNNEGGNGNGGNSEKKLNKNIHSIELSSENASPILYQNIPNPFGSERGTKIRYFVPDNMNSPMIVFFDEFGSKLQTFAITETGMGELDVTASNLVSGIYSYSLFINGKVVDTKRMVFQK